MTNQPPPHTHQCDLKKPATCREESDTPHHWTAILTNTPPTTNQTRRTRLTALPAVIANRSGTPTLRYPARWRWQTQFTTTLTKLRNLPGPSG